MWHILMLRILTWIPAIPKLPEELWKFREKRVGGVSRSVSILSILTFFPQPALVYPHLDGLTASLCIENLTHTSIIFTSHRSHDRALIGTLGTGWRQVGSLLSGRVLRIGRGSLIRGTIGCIFPSLPHYIPHPPMWPLCCIFVLSLSYMSFCVNCDTFYF